MEQLIEYFACFGEIPINVDIDPFESLEENIKNIYLNNIETLSSQIKPSYLLENPYRKLLISIPRSDGKIFNIFKRANLPESLGGTLINEIVKLGVLEVEKSREKPFRSNSKSPIKKELRQYRIQSKVRFQTPFYRFWFGFIEPHRDEILAGKLEHFWEDVDKRVSKTLSFTFENLSNALLERLFEDKDPIFSKGSLWSKNGEFDLLCYTKNGRVILGECKFKGKKVCKSELNKLKEKSQNAKLETDIFALFSKSGFSRELEEFEEPNLMLFGIKDFEILIKD
jgi:hypothetical protein